MKKLILLIALFYSAFEFFAQNSFGIRQYSHPSTHCTSGKLGLNNPGFLLGGASGIVSANSVNFSIERTDINGVFNGSPQEFQEEYQVFGSSGCSTTTPFPQILNCRELDIVEMASGDYVVVGLTNIGVFFANLSVAGAVVNQAILLTPSARTVHVTPSVTNATEFYFTFTDVNGMHIYNCDQSGALLSGAIIDNSAGGRSLFANGIVQSPFTGNKVTIIGRCQDASNTNQAFFYQIDPGLAGTTTNDLTLYNFSSNSPACYFESIAVTNLGAGLGFLIGGEAEAPTAGFTGRSWILKVGVTGIPLPASAIIQGTLDANSSKIAAVTERFSQFNNENELYGAAVTSVGIVVYKLNDDAVPMSFTVGSADEFLVLSGSGATPAGISYLNPGTTGYDEGLHIYGTLPSTPGEHYLTELYFSGETGCNTPTFVANYDATLPNTSTLTPTRSNGLSLCTNFLIGSSAVLTSGAVCGPFSSVTGGSNNKTAPTGMLKVETDDFTMFPNPSNGVVFISAKNIQEVNVNNILGEPVAVEIFATAISDEHLIDFTTANTGVYFITVRLSDISITRKVIIAKE